MRIVSLETSGLFGSVAAVEDGRVVESNRLDLTRRSAQTLAPAIDQLLKRLGWQAEEIDLVAVADGPGSFTGLRVGVTSAKVLAYAANAEILGISTLEAIAVQTQNWRVLHAILDAHRGQFFAAKFTRQAGLSALGEGEHCVVDRSEWLKSLASGDTVSGPGLIKIRSELPDSIQVAPEEDWEPRAETVGLLAWEKFNSGMRHSIWQLGPRYFRASAAEERKAGVITDM